MYDDREWQKEAREAEMADELARTRPNSAIEDSAITALIGLGVIAGVIGWAPVPLKILAGVVISFFIVRRDVRRWSGWRARSDPSHGRLAKAGRGVQAVLFGVSSVLSVVFVALVFVVIHAVSTST